MLYSDVIYLLLAIVLFSSWPEEGELFELANPFSWWLLKEFFFFSLVLLKIKQAREVAAFLRAQAILKALAFLSFVADVLVFNLPAFLRAQGLKDPFLLDTAGLLLFLHYFLIIWLISGLYERRSPLNTLTLGQYVGAHGRLLLPFLVPWLVVNLLFEFLERFLAPRHDVFYEVWYFGSFVVALLILVPPLAAKLWDCQPLPESRLRRLITEYLHREKTKLAEILLWQTFGGRLLTAGVIGLIPRFRYLLISPGLLAALEEVEILSVVAHEVGHLKRHHMLWLVVFFLFFSLLVYLAFAPLFLVLLAYFPYPEWLGSPSGAEYFLPEAIFSLGLILSVILYFRFLFGFFLRNFERQADLYCLESLGTAEGLIRSLKKIAALSGHTEDLPSWHHYSIRERINFLLEATKDPRLIKRHHQKVRTALLSYFLLVGLAGLILSQIPKEDLEKKASLNLTIGSLLREVALFPRAETMSLLGSAYYELGREDKALLWFKKAYQLDPQDPELLNNLAWLLVTAKNPDLREPKKGLRLALEACVERPLATHLDTLAEAWFVNHKPHKACLYSSLALDRAQEAPDYYPNQDYYQKQKERFCHAARQTQTLP